MNIDRLYISLNELYTEENLNDISSSVIGYYKDKNYDSIRNLMQRISIIINYKDKRINKIFSKLMMLYHPDKINYYLRELEKHYRAKDKDGLYLLSHILYIYDGINNETIEDSSEIGDIFSSQTQWIVDEDELSEFQTFTIEDIIEDEQKIYIEDETPGDNDDEGIGFVKAVKQKEYGNLSIDMDIYHIKDLEGELELSGYAIDDLDGIEHCRFITHLDLSNNRISDITKLYNLKLLQELYISNNEIDDIEPLRKLTNIKALDLSENNIVDVSVLLHLPKLEYVNLIGNHVPPIQISELEEAEIVVVW